MKKFLPFWIKIGVGILIGVLCYFIASVCKSPVKIRETDAKYMSRLIEAPKDGSLPTEHDAKDVIAYALWNAANSNCKITTSGTTKASIATQKISVERVIIDKKCMVSTVSTGFITVAGQKFYANNKVLMRNSSKIEGDNVTWSTDAPECISYNEMIRRVGWLPFQANGYIISLDTLLNQEEIKVEKTENDLYKISFDLNPEPDYAPFWYRREIVYDANSTILPIFKKIHIDLRIDKDYRIIYQNTNEVYTIQSYGIKADTNTQIEDHFTYDNLEFDKDALAYFSQYENVEAQEETTDPIVKEDIVSMLVSSLQNGVNDVLFDVDAKVDKLNIKGNATLNLYDLKNIKFKLKLDDIVNFEYLDSNMYFDGLGFKLKGSKNDLQTILNKINKGASKGIDAKALLDNINNAKLVENGNNKQIDAKLDIYGIPLELSANIDKIDNGYVLNNLNVKTNILKRDISLNIKKGNTIIPDKDYSDYQNLSDLMPIINKALDYLDKKNFEFDFDTTIYNQTKDKIKLSGNLKLKLYDNNEFDLEINALLKQDGKEDLTLNVKLISDEYYKQNKIDSKGMIFVSVGPTADNQLRLQAPLADAYSVLNTVLKVFGLNLNIFEKYSDFNFKDIDLYQIRNLINIDLSNVSEFNIKDIIKEFTIKDHILNAKINLNKNKNELITLILDANKDNDITTKLNIDNIILKQTETDTNKLKLSLNSKDTKEVVIKSDDNTYVLINNIDDLLNGFVATSTLKDFNIKGDVNLDLTFFGTTFKNVIGVDLKANVDENKKPTIHLNLDLEKLDTTFKVLVTTSKLDIYYKDNYVYIKKISKEDTYELKVESKKFLKDIKYYVVEFGLGIPNSIMNLFNSTDSQEQKREFNKIINSYKYENNKYNVKLDMAALLKNKNYEILDFTLDLNEYIYKDNTKVKMLTGIENVSFSIMKLVNINIKELKLINVEDGKITKVDMTDAINYITNNSNELGIIYKNGQKEA